MGARSAPLFFVPRFRRNAQIFEIVHSNWGCITRKDPVIREPPIRNFVFPVPLNDDDTAIHTNGRPII